MSARGGWAARAEDGSILALRAVVGLYRLIGAKPVRALLWPIALYFAAMKPTTRRGSLGYLRALRTRPGGREAVPDEPGFGHVVRHVHAFSVSIFERIVALSGRFDTVSFDHAGSEHLFALAREGRGAILLGSHLGSFDMMRLLASDHGLTVNVLMYTQHAARINGFFERLDPERRVRVLNLDPSSTRTAFEIRQVLERGEFVGILGDRAFGDERVRKVDFLGRPAPFALQPFLLSIVLRVPLLFAICVQRAPGHFEAVVEVLHDGGAVPRAERELRAEKLLEAYVARLERWCERTPYQWFNFHDTWSDAIGGRP